MYNFYILYFLITAGFNQLSRKGYIMGKHSKRQYQQTKLNHMVQQSRRSEEWLHQHLWNLQAPQTIREQNIWPPENPKTTANSEGGGSTDTNLEDRSSSISTLIPNAVAKTSAPIVTQTNSNIPLGNSVELVFSKAIKFI